MKKLDANMQKLIYKQKLGFFATVNKYGFANVSPKATFIVLNDQQIIFADIRSPNTIKNLKDNPSFELCFIDQFARKGFKTRGHAIILAKNSSEYVKLYPLFAEFGELQNKIKHIIKLNITWTSQITSPAYDIGSTEDELKKQWKEYYLNDK